MADKKKIIRASTVPISLQLFLDGTVEQLREKYDLVLLSSPGRELDRMRDKYNVRSVAVPMERHISIAGDLPALFRLIRIFRREKPDMVHSMTPKAGLLCMVASRVCRVPRRVHTFTGLIWPDATGFKRYVLMFTDRLTCLCATHIIPEGQGVMNDLQAHITKKNMKILGNGNVRGVDMVRFSRRREVEDSAGKIRNTVFTFLFVGRLVEDKGISELVEAFRRLRDTYKNTRLLLVGQTEDKLSPLKQSTVDLMNSNAAIEVNGPLFGDELLAYYAASDCLVLPSYREGFPNTVLEAGAMGLPCIVTDVNGSREIIVNGINGLVIPSKDTNALYEAMKKIVEDKSSTCEMARNARPMIESRFEQGYVRRCLFEFYDEIMN